MKHTDGLLCMKCETALYDAHIELVYWFRSMKRKFPDMHISCVYRGKEEQDRAFREGNSMAEWPKSKHNEKPSKAIDVFEIKGGIGVFDPKFYLNLWIETKGSYDIAWGGNFKTLKDMPHFEVQS